MAVKSRVPMQVAPEFEKRIKELQKKIMQKQGEVVSLRDLTEKVAKNQSFEDLENSLLNVGNVDIKVKMDRRGK